MRGIQRSVALRNQKQMDVRYEYGNMDREQLMFEVQAKQCSTCIYRPDSPLDIKRLESQIADPHMRGFLSGHRICHHSGTACCRGFWNRHKNDFTLGQIAQRIGFVTFVDHGTIQEKRP